MKLEEFRVQNYRSIVDSQTLKISDITALIGPNEAGKSSILQGLASISPDWIYGTFDLTQLEGISKRFWDGDLKSKDIPIIKVVFRLEPQDKEKLKEILGTEITDSKFNITKYFDEFYSFEIQGQSFRIPSRDKLLSIKHQIKQVISSLSTNGEDYLKHDPNKQFNPQFESVLTNLGKVTRKGIALGEASNALEAVQEFQELGVEEDFKNNVASSVSKIKNQVNSSYPKNSVEISLYDFLLSNMPNTVYFKTYDILEDEVAITELKDNASKHKTFINLLKLADLKLDSLERITDQKQQQAYIEQANGKATRLLRDAWHQEQLELAFRYDKGKIMVFTKNSAAVETLLPPSLGSEGFQWYLGFYINFGASTNAEFKNAILLLDDPGVFLHPKGHKDLLALFDEYLERDVTTIYSTHLPFLIPREKLHRLRLVQKISEGHSIVTEKFYAVADKDILYPLRAALGITLGDSLFVGESTIVTEGVVDRILIFGMLEEFKKRNLKSIFNIGKLEVLAGGGARGAKNYSIMLQIENLPYAVVLDNDGEGRDSRDDFIKDGIPEEKIILLSSTTADSQKDYDIEDLFPLEVYAQAFHEVHGKKIGLDMSETLQKFQNGNDKVVNKAKNVLKSKKVNYDLDKQSVAYEMLRIISKQGQLDDITIKNFSNLFDNINSQVTIYEK